MEQKLRFRNGSQEQEIETQFLCEHCGMIQCSVLRARLVDLAGIFTLRLPVPAPVCFQVLAKKQPFSENLEGIVQADASEGMAVKTGRDGEKSTVREYQIGDSVRDIHWKLTSKLGKPMVREAEMSFDPSVLVAFDFSGSPECMDRTLGRLQGLADSLLECSYNCLLVWYDAAHKSLIKIPVVSKEDLSETVRRICSTRLPEHTEDIRSLLRRSDEPETDFLFIVGPDKVDIPGEMGGGAL